MNRVLARIASLLSLPLMLAGHSLAALALDLDEAQRRTDTAKGRRR